MKVIITEVKIGWFKNEYSELREFDEWKYEYLPVIDDVLFINDEQYKVLQRSFHCIDIVQIYVRKV